MIYKMTITSDTEGKKTWNYEFCPAMFPLWEWLRFVFKIRKDMMEYRSRFYNLPADKLTGVFKTKIIKNPKSSK